ncbi:hypothetical protein SteCoe_25896 [Stentor coeruleus]|uniref:Uncharacterized protein n=1 Tax=Stentor coeruleus TaxID=5963 RepID=A0A1R2BE51_9CILI|nr:hypothetical protein SteCoe_25896 [Stentor coeruleus]
MSSDDTASRLSGKLLQGWCMLDKSCEKCFTPIMRDKEKKEYCCGCQEFLNQKPIEKKPEPKLVVEEVPPQIRIAPSNAAFKIEKCIEKYADELMAIESIDDAFRTVELIEKLSNIRKNLA